MSIAWYLFKRKHLHESLNSFTLSPFDPPKTHFLFNLGIPQMRFEKKEIWRFWIGGWGKCLVCMLKFWRFRPIWKFQNPKLSRSTIFGHWCTFWIEGWTLELSLSFPKTILRYLKKKNTRGVLSPKSVWLGVFCVFCSQCSETCNSKTEFLRIPERCIQ